MAPGEAGMDEPVTQLRRVHSRGPHEPPPPCDICGGPTVERQCKIICQRCGYTRDCSDP